MEYLFGKPNKTLNLEFRTRVWVVDYNGLIFNIFTAKGKGTSIEICNYDHTSIMNGTKDDEIINFLEELYELINS